MFQKTYLEVENAENKLKSEGVLVKNDFRLRGVQERLCEENRDFLKNCHICHIKLKICIFRGLGSHEISR